MADTVEQLRKKLDEASAKAKSAYRAIHFSESFDKPSLEQQYNYAKQNNTKNLAQIEAKYRKAQEDYSKLQTSVDDLEKQVAEAEKGAATKKKTQATQKAAKSTYDKAMSDLKKAEDEFGFYGGQEKYVAAYKAAAAAKEAADAAGLTTPELPAQKTPVELPKKDTGKTDAIGNQTVVDPSLSEFFNTLADPKNTKELISVQKDLIKNFGYKGKADGRWSTAFQKAVTDIFSLRATLPTALKGTDVRSFILKPPANLDLSAGGGYGTQTDVTKSVDKMTPAEVDALISKSALSILGRDITPQDKSASWYTDLTSAINKMVESGSVTKATTTTGPKGSTTSRITTPGYTQKDAAKLIESSLKTADPESLARKDRVDFMQWMFSNLGSR